MAINGKYFDFKLFTTYRNYTRVIYYTFLWENFQYTQNSSLHTGILLNWIILTCSNRRTWLWTDEQNIPLLWPGKKHKQMDR